MALTEIQKSNRRQSEERLGSRVKTSVYKYPRTNKFGRTFYYKVPLWQTYVDQAEYAKFEKKIIKAYRDFVKKNKFVPNKGDLVKITGEAVHRVENVLKRNNLKFTVGIRPDQFRGGASEEYLASLNKFPAGSDKEKRFIKELTKRFKYPLNSAAAVEAGVLSKAELAKEFDLTKKQTSTYMAKYSKGLKYPSPPYEGKEYKKFKQAERRGFIKDVSVPKYERQLADLKLGTKNIDLAHRASLRQVRQVGLPYLVQNLGLDPKIVNQELVIPFEKKLEHIYAEQNKLIKNLKPGEVPKTIQKQLEALNAKITANVEKSGRALQGVLIDEKTLKPSIYGIDYKKVLGAGTVEGTVKGLTPDKIEMIKLNMPEQVNAQKKLIDIFNKSSTPDKVQTAIRLGCLAAAEGGRIGYALGSGTMNCVNTKLTNEPVQSSMKLRVAEGVGKIKPAATSFLKMLGRGGLRATPLAALAAAGAAVEPLVKQFRIDDPTTYLTNEGQMKGMLLATIEGETPKVDDEILKWQTPAHGAATLAGAIPGAGAVYKARRGIPEHKFVGPMPKGVGPARAALGIKGVLGKALGASFSPLAVAATLPLSVAAQKSGGTDLGDIATDPMNWMGPAFAASGAEMASKGIKNPLLLKALRMGMSPRTLRLISSRLGMPGLAISAGMWGYDKWKNRSVNDED